ncbi:hypothetical protein QUF75_15565 [Desulfococcaceae bacterium HSG7]|nr:hypothetical protein [Desulfococcaceae bacterium HSG7]
MPENTAWSAKIKRGGFLPALNPQASGRNRMLKITALNLCIPKLSIY